MNMPRLLRQLTLGLAAITAAVAIATVSAPGHAAAASGYQYPCSPYVVGGYNFGQYVSGWGYHSGQDVACSSGTPEYAVADGVVVYSARTPDSYRWGNLVMIQHTNADGSQVVSLYGHMADNRQVAAGQSVGKGQLLGFVGPAWTPANGNWGDHLHFGIHYGGYGAAIGTYASWVHGYESAQALGGWANPATYIATHPGGGVTPPPPPAITDYQIDSVTPLGYTTAKNGEYYFDFKLRNTGTIAWKINGDHPMRLGTSGPLDRGSGFSVGEIGQGWSANNRIALMADTNPGEVGTFRARFNNSAVPPGRYVERFTPVVEGIAWLADRGLYVTVDVAQPRYGSQWVGQAAYGQLNPTNTATPVDSTYLLPGQKLNLKSYIRNTGDIAWSSTGPNPVRLGTSHPNDRPDGFATGGDTSIPASENWPNYNRPSGIDGRFDPASNSITPTGTINPGEIAVFSFTITVPNAPGDYTVYYNPVVEGLGWMNDLGMWYRLRILPPGFHYEYAGQDNPAPVTYGGGGSQAKVRLRNIGQSFWPVNGNVRLATDRNRDRLSSFQSNDWLAANRASSLDVNVTNPGRTTVGPGEVAEFSFTISNPATTDGTYNEYFRPVVEGQTWMPEDYGLYVPVTVQSPAWAMQYAGQRTDKDISQLHYGDTFTATLMLKNTGSQTWRADGSNPARIGTARPQDRASGFADFTSPDRWIGANRASGVDGIVSNILSAQSGTGGLVPTPNATQGQIAYFNIPMKVPAVPTGAYNEYFNLVAEGATWMQDVGIYFPLRVVGP